MSERKNLFFETLKSSVDEMDERHRGYRKELMLLVAEIINLEREHKQARTNIVKRIGDKIELAGRELNQARAQNEN